MGFTAKHRYLSLPSLTTLKVLHLAKKKIHRLTAANCELQHTFDFSQLDYQVWSAIEVHVGLLQASTYWESFDSVISFLYQSFQSN